ncbi:hypothetical protein MTO96_005789 [Rhipicephalus appendiculatus]
MPPRIHFHQAHSVRTTSVNEDTRTRTRLRPRRSEEHCAAAPPPCEPRLHRGSRRLSAPTAGYRGGAALSEAREPRRVAQTFERARAKRLQPESNSSREPVAPERGRPPLPPPRRFAMRPSLRKVGFGSHRRGSL